MDIARMKDILNQRRETRQLYRKELIRITEVGGEITIAGAYPDALLTALGVLTESEPLYMRFALVVDEWHAFITTPPTHVSVSAGTVRDSSIVGAMINNLEPNQGVQGIVNTPTHIGKK